MPKEAVSIVLIGIGGYGNTYLKKLLDDPGSTTIEGVVDIDPQKSLEYNRLVEKNIPIFSSIEEFYDSHQADLAIISTPIYLHKSQSCYALHHGSHVLCEKPISASLYDVEEMIEARDESGKFLAIGFNWSFYPSVQELKQDILAGTFGKPKRFKTSVLWPRTEDYYNRSAWAGKKYTDNGDPILDSVANNATSHFLHHMFYLLGPSKEESCQIDRVIAELYRANPIESFDTCAVRIWTKEEVEVLFYATHAVRDRIGPNFVFEFEDAIITYTIEKDTNKVIAKFHDGRIKEYGDPEKDRLVKLQTCIDAAASDSREILCGPEAARTQVECIQAMHASVPDIPFFPEHLIRHEKEQKLNWVEGLDDILLECFDKWSLPHESGINWSQHGEIIGSK